MRTSKRLRTGVGVLVAGLFIAASAAPGFLWAADHLDAPGSFQSPGARHDADINDLYVFPTADHTRTVVALTTHPGLGLVTTGASMAYATDVTYRINVDSTGDAVADTVWALRFDAPNGDGQQRYTVTRYAGRNATTMATGNERGSGMTGSTVHLRGDADAFAGPRSDPFFFDLDAFKHTIAGDPSRSFCDGQQTDFFAPLNTNAIVLEMPNDSLAPQISVWASTVSSTGQLIDQMGRPAINTVFNSGTDKNDFNHTAPADQPTALSGKFHNNVVNTLLAFSATDPQGAYSSGEAGVLAGVLLPDVLPYTVGTTTLGALNGRALTDDVIDIELNLVTGGYPFAGRDGTGGIPSDCVGAHTDYLSAFPYLGNPHS